MQIFLSNQAKGCALAEDAADLIEKIIQTIAQMNGLKAEAQVSVTLVGDVEIRAINHAYRSLDQVTDVISFALNEGETETIIDGPTEELLGEIVVCLPQAARQAEEYGHSLARELGYLVVHGMLHVLGYDHANADEQQIMRAEEEKILAKFALGRN